ncbi:MAG: nickel pincer cofactor biosynthesis protein LarC [Candidatus Hodarchaeales archaeon]
MSYLIIDPRLSGAAGDIFIAALLNLKDHDFKSYFCSLFQTTLQGIDPSFEVTWSDIRRKGFSGTRLQVKAEKKFKPQEMLTKIEDIGGKLGLTKYAIDIAKRALKYIILAEQNVHGFDSSEKVHFHELSTTDTIFDILGAVYLLENLDLAKMKKYIFPIAVGSGTINISHGEVTVPAPATLEIIQEAGLTIQGSNIQGELLTPTGAAVIAALKPELITELPIMSIKNIGRSFGTREYKDSNAFFQIIIANPPLTLRKEYITVLETNVDDVNGESLGYLFDVLYEKNMVLDLSLIHTITKKNRPGILIRAIVDPQKTQEVTTILINELGTLGVRVLHGYRHIVPRRSETKTIDIQGHDENIRVKKSYLGEKLVQRKIEFEDLKQLAKQKNISLRQARDLVLTKLLKEDNHNE